MTKMIALRLPEGALAEIDRERRKSSLTRSAAIKQALEYWVKRRRYEAQLEREAAAYERMPVASGEFSSLIEAQTWPK